MAEKDALIEPAAPRIAPLDGLRGLAILLVMQSHFYGMTASHALGVGQPSTHAIDEAANRVFSVGWSGVDLFFVLSGFLITGILVDAKGGTGYFRNFYARRALRIFPVYYAFLFLVFVVGPHISYIEDVAGIDEASRYQAWYWTHTYNFALVIDGVVDRVPFLYGHFWSLAIEEQFYLVWPALVLVLPRRPLMALCLALVAGALAWRFLLFNDPPAPFTNNAGLSFTLARIDSLALGSLIALAIRDPEVFRRVMAIAPAITAVALVTLAVIVYRIGSMDGFRAPMQTVGITALAFVFAGLLLNVISSPTGPLAALFSNPVLRFFGKYSYGLYVIHLLVAFRLVVSLEYLFEVPVAWGMELPAKLLFNLAATGVCLAIAVASWHLFESQVLKLKRFVPYGDARRPVAAARTSAAAVAVVSTVARVPAKADE